MIIQWMGHSCFKIQDKTGADGVIITTDPYDKSIGSKAPNYESDIVTISRDVKECNNIKSLRGNPFLINSSGEYDVKGVSVHGIDTANGPESDSRNIIFRFEIDDISVSHLGNLSKVLDNKQLEVLVGTDILLIPVGGKSVLDAKKAVEVVSQIEPRIVIPMCYKVKGIKDDFDDVEKFIKEMGVKPTEEERLKISKKDLPQEDMELVIMKL